MKKLLTVKFAIKLRCQDCQEGRISNCKNKKCFLFQKTVAGAKGRSKAIKDYCRWCRNGLSMSVCSSPKCPIYLYLNKIPVSDSLIHSNKRKLTKTQKKAISDRLRSSRTKSIGKDSKKHSEVGKIDKHR
jgi:hypothetical protein